PRRPRGRPARRAVRRVRVELVEPAGRPGPRRAPTRAARAASSFETSCFSSASLESISLTVLSTKSAKVNLLVYRRNCPAKRYTPLLSAVLALLHKSTEYRRLGQRARWSIAFEQSLELAQ